MRRLCFFRLVLQAFCEFVCYDVLNSIGGFQCVLRWTMRRRIAARRYDECPPICDAVAVAACFYWKQVLCLQRSVAAARLLRRYGLPGRLVIGYRPSPFVSHAWVEVNDRVVNDSPGYKLRMQVLCSA